jgi:hypothetical protein
MLARDRNARPARTAAIGRALRSAMTDAGLDASALAEVVRGAASPIACRLAGIAPPEVTPAQARAATSGVTAVARPRRAPQGEATTLSGGWGDPNES